jgi:hypothetical protein
MLETLRHVFGAGRAWAEEKRQQKEVVDAGLQPGAQGQLKELRRLTAQLSGGDRAGMQQGDRAYGDTDRRLKPEGDHPQVEGGLGF